MSGDRYGCTLCQCRWFIIVVVVFTLVDITIFNDIIVFIVFTVVVFVVLICSINIIFCRGRPARVKASNVAEKDA